MSKIARTLSQVMRAPIMSVIKSAPSIAGLFATPILAGNEGPVIPLILSYDNGPYMDDPHYICDGPWGGFGDQTWYHMKGMPPRNVYECSPFGTDRKWLRVWDGKLKKWRKVTKAETKKLEAKP